MRGKHGFSAHEVLEPQGRESRPVRNEAEEPCLRLLEEANDFSHRLHTVFRHLLSEALVIRLGVTERDLSTREDHAHLVEREPRFREREALRAEQMENHRRRTNIMPDSREPVVDERGSHLVEVLELPAR